MSRWLITALFLLVLGGCGCRDDEEPKGNYEWDFQQQEWVLVPYEDD